MASMSGRSSRSTLMLTKRSFISWAISGFSNDSWAMTWHQWQAEYPTESKIGLSLLRASVSASSPHGCQCTGLLACCRRYGDVSPPSRLLKPVGRCRSVPYRDSSASTNEEIGVQDDDSSQKHGANSECDESL